MNRWGLKIGKKSQNCSESRAFVENKLRSDRSGSTIWILTFRMKTGIMKSYRLFTEFMTIWVQNGV